MKLILEEIYNKLKDKNVIYCILRKYELKDGDVDLMLLSKDLKKLESIMEHYKAVKVDSVLYAPHVQYHIPYIENNIVKYFIIDCIFDFMFGKDTNTVCVKIDKGDFISNLKRSENGYIVPSHEYATIFLAIHIFIENQSSKKDRRFNELVEYYNKCNKNRIENIVDNLLIDNQELGVFNIDNIDKVFKSIRIKRNKKKFLILKVFNIVKRKIFLRKGLVVSFIGVDGTGKSTLSAALYQNLNNNKNKVLDVFYLGDRKKSKKVERLKDVYRKKANKYGVLFSIYKISSLFIYFLKRLVLSYKFYLYSREKIVLSDRFILDRLIPSPNTKKINGLHIVMLRIFKVFIKLPDVIYLLDGDAKMISSRKAEYTYKDTLNGIGYQKEVLNKSNINYELLNTTDHTVKELTDILLINISNTKRKKVFNV